MAFHNVYHAYKRNQRFLIFWVVNTGNSIFRKTGEGELNTTGQVSLALIKDTCRRIAVKLNRNMIPDAIYRLLGSTINGRKILNEAYSNLEAWLPDDEMRKGNESHLAMINALEEAYEILGGKEWENAKGTKELPLEIDDSALHQELSNNIFDALQPTQPTAQSDSESDHDLPARHGAVTAINRRRRATGKRKNRRKAKKADGQTKESGTADDTTTIPLDNCRFSEDELLPKAEYVVVVYGFVRQWSHLRCFLQSVWREVVYHGLNSAIAATLTHLAITLVRQTEAAIFVDFPGHASFENMAPLLTQFCGGRTIYLMNINEEGLTGVDASALDYLELFLVHTHEHLRDFLKDFQKNYSGKPTKKMGKALRGWDPEADLFDFTHDQLLQWRRSYMINFLYDLVNYHTSRTRTRTDTKNGDNGHWGKHWSMQDIGNVEQGFMQVHQLSAVVAHLAREKPERDAESGEQWRTPPYLVFELQCIADAACISRGWIASTSRGHALVKPPNGPYSATRDIDIFLDTPHGSVKSNLLLSMTQLQQVLEYFFPKAAKDVQTLLESLTSGFRISPEALDIPQTPPTATSQLVSRGLLDSSPYICGTELAEGLDLAYRCVTGIWEKLPELVLLLHLYRMLREEGYMSTNGVLSSLIAAFPIKFFGDARLTDVKELKERRFVDALKRHTTTDQRPSHGLFALKEQRSFLGMVRNSNWDMDRVRDDELPLTGTYVGARALRQYEVAKASGVKGELLKRFNRLAPGVSDEAFEMLLSKHASPTVWFGSHARPLNHDRR